MSGHPRAPKGIPTGGEFVPSGHAESAVTLGSEAIAEPLPDPVCLGDGASYVPIDPGGQVTIRRGGRTAVVPTTAKIYDRAFARTWIGEGTAGVAYVAKIDDHYAAVLDIADHDGRPVARSMQVVPDYRQAAFASGQLYRSSAVASLPNLADDGSGGRDPAVAHRNLRALPNSTEVLVEIPSLPGRPARLVATSEPVPAGTSGPRRFTNGDTGAQWEIHDLDDGNLPDGQGVRISSAVVTAEAADRRRKPSVGRGGLFAEL